MRGRRALAAALAAALLSPAALAAPAAEDERPRLAGSEVPAPKRRKLVLPEYPDEAKNRGVRGIVLVELVIERDGRVGEARVLRSIPLLDEAALQAVRQWEYEVTRVEGQPVRVLISVPITFSLKLPDVTRQEGVPELRSGVVPAFPEGGAGSATVEAEVTLDAEGKVSEILVTRGESPWTDAVVKALRTWAFQPESSGAVVSFKLRAQFRRGSGNEEPRVELDLSSPRVSETVEPPTVPAAVVPAPSTPAATAPAAPGPSPTPAAPPIEVIRVPPRAAPPEPQPSPAGAPAAAAPAAATPAAPPTRASEPGVSAVRDVSLAVGVPDLTGGRRPVVPPVARMTGATGTVVVEFSVATSGATHLGRVDGPELLREAAQQMVASWVFRRTSTERLFLTARVEFGQNEARATVSPAQ